MGVPSASRGALRITTGRPSGRRTTTSKSPCGSRPRSRVTWSRSAREADPSIQSSKAGDQLLRQPGAGGGVVVLEEDVGVAVLGRDLGQPLRPQVEVGRR